MILGRKIGQSQLLNLLNSTAMPQKSKSAIPGFRTLDLVQKCSPQLLLKMKNFQVSNNRSPLYYLRLCLQRCGVPKLTCLHLSRNRFPMLCLKKIFFKILFCCSWSQAYDYIRCWNKVMPILLTGQSRGSSVMLTPKSSNQALLSCRFSV